ncbi:hypothetical protein AVEN_264297-1 [Araneus ventricosus]|uniref:Uncharacterized protein n=1 Tax=Araneus ventricosus TaxID=182803 RepID=A0A4Y2E0N1_ARAVE|nr:hypothetical protein AVEN_264297-1 [Araneus ventricosus]
MAVGRQRHGRGEKFPIKLPLLSPAQKFSTPSPHHGNPFNKSPPSGIPPYRDWAILGLLSMVSYRLVVPHPTHEFGVDSSASLLPFILSFPLDTLGIALISILLTYPLPLSCFSQPAPSTTLSSLSFAEMKSVSGQPF